MSLRSCALAWALPLALVAAPLSAATLLLAVEETIDGQPFSEPRPFTEGVLAALFEADHIAFDLPADAGVPSPADLLVLAAETRAACVLVLRAAATRNAAAEDGTYLAVSVAVELLDAETGATLLSDRIEGSNRGRERDVGVVELGRELGRETAARLAGPLAVNPPRP